MSNLLAVIVSVALASAPSSGPTTPVAPAPPPSAANATPAAEASTKVDTASAEPLPAAVKPVGVLPPDLAGYQNLKWGMTIEEVKEGMPDIKRSPRGLWLKFGVVAGLEAVLSPRFRNDRLFSVLVLFPREKDARLTTPEKVAALEAALTKKYGEGRISTVGIDRVVKWANDVTTITLRSGFDGAMLSYENVALNKQAEQLSTDGL